MRSAFFFLALAALLFARETAAPRETPVAAPAELGMSAPELDTIGPAVDRLIEE